MNVEKFPRLKMYCSIVIRLKTKCDILLKVKEEQNTMYLYIILYILDSKYLIYLWKSMKAVKTLILQVK